MTIFKPTSKRPLHRGVQILLKLFSGVPSIAPSRVLLRALFKWIFDDRHVFPVEIFRHALIVDSRQASPKLPFAIVGSIKLAAMAIRSHAHSSPLNLFCDELGVCRGDGFRQFSAGFHPVNSHRRCAFSPHEIMVTDVYKSHIFRVIQRGSFYILP